MPPPTTRWALELARAIRARELSAREVIEAHIAVLERVQPRINAIARDRFDDARREADAADRGVAAAAEGGAIPLAVTDTSELTLWIESYNPLYGQTGNA